MRSTLPTPSVKKSGFQPESHRWREERRVAHRVPCRVRTTSHTGSGRVSLVGHTVNMSANGMGVQVGRPMGPGEHVDVLLPQLAGEPTQFLGKVVHCRRVSAGTYELGIHVYPDADDE